MGERGTLACATEGAGLRNRTIGVGTPPHIDPFLARFSRENPLSDVAVAKMNGCSWLVGLFCDQHVFI
jgi:hypothetical protein